MTKFSKWSAITSKTYTRWHRVF